LIKEVVSEVVEEIVEGTAAEKTEEAEDDEEIKRMEDNGEEGKAIAEAEDEHFDSSPVQLLDKLF